MDLRPLHLPLLLGLFCARNLAAAPAPAPTAAPASAPPAAPADAAGDSAVLMDKVDVTTRQAVSINSIDRKTYLVGQDITSAGGSVADLLQNVPSLSLDLDGNVSLRGSASVTILIDGRESSLLGANRAAALEQMSADSLARVEVITNPSAKYKPDGTGGIINLVTRRNTVPGLAATWTTNAGPDGRYNSTFFLDRKSAHLDAFLSLSQRQDTRNRTNLRRRTVADTTAAPGYTEEQDTREQGRPLSRIVRGGLDVHPSEQTAFGVAAHYDQRTMLRRELTRDRLDYTDGITRPLDFDRARVDDDFERSSDVSAHFKHTFAAEDHMFAADVRFSNELEQEDNTFTETHRSPASADSLDATLIRQLDHGVELNLEYTRPLPADIQLESGYAWERHRNDLDFRGSYLDPVTDAWLTDTIKTNRFLYTEVVQALYATGERSFGPYGVLAGVRLEQADTTSQLAGTGTAIPNHYFRLYPSLHLSRHLNDQHELQLNYSHRVRRPEGDELNPFPEYRDPRNLRVGNPLLLPKDIHSFEIGHHYQNGDTSIISTLYYRRHVHDLTDVTTVRPDGTFVTTKTNLGSRNDLGLELAAEGDLNPALSCNFSGNLFLDELDAASVGSPARRSAMSHLLKLGLTWRVRTGTVLQLATQYNSRRLTTEGSIGALYGTNLGLRQDLWHKRAALTLTISDVFNTRREVRRISTPALTESYGRKRDGRVIYLGFTYRFGAAAAKPKDEALKFDDSI